MAAVASLARRWRWTAHLPGRGGSLLAVLRRMRSEARRVAAAAGRMRGRGRVGRFPAGAACRQSPQDPQMPAMSHPTAWCPLEAGTISVFSSSRLDIACYMEAMLESPPVFFGKFHLLEGWAQSRGFSLERPNRNSCHVRGWVSNGERRARFRQLWVRAGYEGHRKSFREFHRGVCDSFPDDLRNVDADHVINKARIPADAWVQLFPVAAAANRRYGSAFERYFPEVGVETKQLDLSPLIAFKLFCGRVPANQSELDRAMKDVRGHFLQEIPEIRAYCDRIERAVRCHMSRDNAGARRHDIARLGEPRAPASDSHATILDRLLTSGTPLHFAAQEGNAALVAVLLYEDERPDARLDSGDTPLHFAAHFGHADVATYLIAAGADPNATRGSGTTPLHFASYQGHASTVAALIAGGADIDRVRDHGGTALHLAVQQDHVKVVTVLLKAGADPSIRRFDGCAPLHLAAYHDKLRISRLLLNHGADPRSALDDGRTPFDLARPKWRAAVSHHTPTTPV